MKEAINPITNTDLTYYQTGFEDMDDCEMIWQLN